MLAGDPLWCTTEATDNGEAKDKGPQTSHRVVLCGLPQGHFVLSIFTVEGLVHEDIAFKDL